MSTVPLLEDEATTEAARAGGPSHDSVDGQAHGERPLSSQWIKPSPVWMLLLVSVAAISTSGTVAPRMEIYTRTICRAYGLDASPAECMANTEVQAATAKLTALLYTASGFLTTLTAAWWGSLSDCYGRTRIFRFNYMGLILSDFLFLTVTRFWYALPGTYWWFAVGPIIEGLVGGVSVASILMHAYISDTSDPDARSRAFSQLMGLLFVGMSVGPLLSGYIMRATGQLLPVFYLTTAIDTTCAVCVWLVLPESLSAAEMQGPRVLRAQRMRSMGPGLMGSLKRVGSTLDIVSPLLVLLPKKVEHVGSKRLIDWSMTVLGVAYGFGVLIQASMPQQIQYSYLVFGWTSGDISYWLGAIHIAKAVYLALIFPGIVKLLTYIWTQRQHSNSEFEPLLSGEVESTPNVRHSKKIGPVASMDLLLARVAVVLDLAFYALTFGTTSGALFALYTMCISLGTSFGPTMQSLALDLYSRRGGVDTGKLLGALTVVSALSSHIIGPAIFGITYAGTVATVPGSFFLVGCAALFVSLVLLMFIRLRKEEPRSQSDVDDRAGFHSVGVTYDTPQRTAGDLASSQCSVGT